MQNCHWKPREAEGSPACRETRAVSADMVLGAPGCAAGKDWMEGCVIEQYGRVKNVGG